MSDNYMQAAGARLRSGTAARMAGVPVTTLRVWERRYGVVAGVKTPTGQRLYSPHDVLRLKLLRQLTQNGHAIGTIATLELEELQALADTESAVGTTPNQAVTLRDAPPSRVVVVGAAAVHRVAALANCLLLSGHSTLAQAGAWAQTQATRPPQAAPHDPAPPLGEVDVLLVQMASLQPLAVDAVLALAATLRATATVVLYTFGSQLSVQALRAAGVSVQREPVTGAALAQWLQRPSLARGARRGDGTDAGDAGDMASAGPGAALGHPHPPSPSTPLSLHLSTRFPGGSIDPRRFTPTELAELTDLAENDGHSAVIFCECLRHLAGIVTQIAAFEDYSADCASTSVADAALHLHLHEVAGAARSRFEQALQRVVAVEGVFLGGRTDGPVID